MSNIIKPTIGRKVWYRHDGQPTFDAIGGMVHPVAYDNQPMDATVVYVWSDRMVNLRITDHAGNTFSLTYVTLMQDGDATTLDRYCEWMPYQKGQARKDSAFGSTIVSGTPTGGPLTIARGFHAEQAQVGAINAASQASGAIQGGFSLDSDKLLTGACDLSGEGSCEACQ